MAHHFFTRVTVGAITGMAAVAIATAGSAQADMNYSYDASSTYTDAGIDKSSGDVRAPVVVAQPQTHAYMPAWKYAVRSHADIYGSPSSAYYYYNVLHRPLP